MFDYKEENIMNALQLTLAKPGTLELDARITSFLIHFGIMPHLKGYYFLKQAIELSIPNRQLLMSITKELYPEIAQRFASTPGQVERSIRHAIEVMWKGPGRNLYCRTFGYISDKRPTNGQFIASLTEYFYLRLDL